MTEWIFLSTHFDDVALSAGGMVWELVKRGERVEIWTICAGSPPVDKPLSDYAQLLHIIWELEGVDVPLARSIEDAAGCKVLGARYRRYTLPDCIYRYDPQTGEPVIKDPDLISDPQQPEESHLIPQIADFLRKNITEDSVLVAPLAIGHHRDHKLTCKAADSLGIPIWHYVDYPYVTQEEFNLADWVPPSAEEFSLEITQEGLKAWQDGIACYKSQIVLFWASLDEMRQGIEQYMQSGTGRSLYKF